MDNTKTIWVALIVVGLIAIIALGVGLNGRAPSEVTQGVTNFDTLGLTGLKVGSGCSDSYASCTGTTITQVIEGSCVLAGANLSVAATSTGLFSCPVTGVVSTDEVFVSLGTTTKVTTGQWLLASVIASSTAGFIEVGLTNLTGIANPPAQGGNAATGFASTTRYLILRH